MTFEGARQVRLCQLLQGHILEKHSNLSSGRYDPLMCLRVYNIDKTGHLLLIM